MPATRTTPRDVLIRVAKVEPYSNSYLPPSARAREEAKKFAAAATADSATGDASGGIADASIAVPAITDPSAPTTSSSAAEPNPDAAEPSDRGQRGNSPTLPFLDVDRQEDQTVELSKAATSSAGWNSLLVWARRQRGAQWDASTAIWQVDRYSREYYSFCQDPATTDRSKQPSGAPEEAEDKKQQPAQDADEDEDDKGPTRVASRSREDGNNASPPPVAGGRSIRLLRR